METYPSVQFNPKGTTVTTYTSLDSSFAVTAPTNSDYIWEAAYDIFTQGHEVMIWTDNHGQRPSGSSMGTVTIDGDPYTFWESSSGYIAFVRNTNEASGSLNIEDFFTYLISKGILTDSSSLTQVNYGFEIVNTDDVPATFSVTSYSLTPN